MKMLPFCDIYLRLLTREREYKKYWRNISTLTYRLYFTDNWLWVLSVAWIFSLKLLMMAAKFSHWAQFDCLLFAVEIRSCTMSSRWAKMSYLYISSKSSTVSSRPALDEIPKLMQPSQASTQSWKPLKMILSIACSWYRAKYYFF